MATATIRNIREWKMRVAMGGSLRTRRVLPIGIAVAYLEGSRTAGAGYGSLGRPARPGWSL